MALLPAVNMPILYAKMFTNGNTTDKYFILSLAKVNSKYTDVNSNSSIVNM